jgi:hypothetical protein
MLSSLKLYTFIALFAFTFARKHCKNPNTPKTPKIDYCPTTCTDCSLGTQCQLGTGHVDDDQPECPIYLCNPYAFPAPDCPPPQCDNCGYGKVCQVNGRSDVHCGTAVCVDKPSEPVACASCKEPKGTCDVCGKGQVCVIETYEDCKKCPETKCVTPTLEYVPNK